jgi:hypothetical protein
MDLFVIKQNARIRDQAVSEIAGHPVTFVRAWDQFHRLVMVARVPSDHVIVPVIQRNPNFLVLDKDPGIRWVDAAAVALATAPLPVTPDLAIDADPTREAALRQGWKPRDLEGAGRNGNPGADGGRSTLTGLMLSEMALCEPPKDWNQLRGAAYPWDAVEWKPPSSSWRAPADLVKNKRAEAEAAVQAALDVDGKLEEPQADPDTDPDSEENHVPAEAVTTATNGDGDLLATYGPRATVEGAIAVIRELTAAKSGTQPSINQARYHLKKHELPTPKEDVYSALLRAAALQP